MSSFSFPDTFSMPRWSAFLTEHNLHLPSVLQAIREETAPTHDTAAFDIAALQASAVAELRSTVNSDTFLQACDLHAAGMPFSALKGGVLGSILPPEEIVALYWEADNEVAFKVSLRAAEQAAGNALNVAESHLYSRDELDEVLSRFNHNRTRVEHQRAAEAMTRISHSHFGSAGFDTEVMRFYFGRYLQKFVGVSDVSLDNAAKLFLAHHKDTDFAAFVEVVSECILWNETLESFFASNTPESIRPSMIHSITNSVSKGDFYVRLCVNTMTKLGICTPAYQQAMENALQYMMSFPTRSSVSELEAAKVVIDAMFERNIDPVHYSATITPDNMGLFFDYYADNSATKMNRNTNASILELLQAGVPYRIIRSCAEQVLANDWETGVLPRLLQAFTPADINRYMGLRELVRVNPRDLATLHTHGYVSCAEVQRFMRTNGHPNVAAAAAALTAA